MSDAITHKIIQLIGEISPLVDDCHPLGDQDDLYEAGLKSLAAMRLMVALEAAFGIEFPNDVLHRNAFSTVERIRGIVAPLVAGQPLDR